MVFYGAASITTGWLILRSGFLPRVLGALLIAGGLGFVITNVFAVLAPGLMTPLLLLPTMLALLALSVWLLVKDVDEKSWERAAAS